MCTVSANLKARVLPSKPLLGLTTERTPLSPSHIFPQSAYGLRNGMSTIIDRIDDDQYDGQPLPDNRHRHPTTEKTLGEDPVSIERQRPKHDRRQNIHDEISYGNATPFLDVPNRLWVEGMDHIVETIFAVVVGGWQAGLRGLRLDGELLLVVCVFDLVDSDCARRLTARHALVFNEVDLQELAPIEARWPDERDDDGVQQRREERCDGGVQSRELQLRRVDVDRTAPSTIC